MNVVLISTYELGRQSFSLASLAAWLREAGMTVRCVDLALERLQDADILDAQLIGVSLPMHTATRLAAPVVGRIRELNRDAHVCAFGLYAPLNTQYLQRIGVDTVIGGEFEGSLVELARRLANGLSIKPTDGRPLPAISRERLSFRVPDRSDMPELGRYARLELGSGKTRLVGYTEATRGCKHRCRHCPVVPVYDGAFRAIQRDVVLADIRNQVAMGAQHVTFGDPDFFNGPTHGLEIVRALHREFPEVTYDVTIKIEHLLQQQRHLPVLKDTGCLFVTSAVEALDDRTLQFFDKGHTRADFAEAVRLCRLHGLVLNPTFIPFTPWTTLEGYTELLVTLADLELVDQVAPVQLSIRLLVTHGSRLLELEELRRHLDGPFDPERLIYPWAHPDPEIDRLQQQVSAVVAEAADNGESRRQTFSRILDVVTARLEARQAARLGGMRLPPPAAASIPRLTEPWYC